MSTTHRFGKAAIAFAAVAILAAGCGSSDSSSSKGSSGGSTSVSISAAELTSDFSAMKKLKPVADAGKGMVAVLLPDTTSSTRYVDYDEPYLKRALKAAGLSSSEYKVSNAQGSDDTMKTQADAAITQGASVLIIDPNTPAGGAAIEADAKSKGVGVVDYDRLTLGGSKGRTYVSFDNVKVGQLIGKGEVECITSWKVSKPNILVMDGAATDNNASLFAQGYNGVLKPHFDSGEYVKVGEPAGTWTPSVAATTFEQQYTAHPKMNAVVTPNDDNANAVIAQLQRLQIPPKTFPTTGQDASLPGLQNILKGYQCGTVYKPISQEAQAAVAAALYLRAGQALPKSLVNGTTKDSESNTKVTSILLTPIWVTADNMAKTVVADNFRTASDICISQLTAACSSAGIH